MKYSFSREEAVQRKIRELVADFQRHKRRESIYKDLEEFLSERENAGLFYFNSGGNISKEKLERLAQERKYGKGIATRLYNVLHWVGECLGQIPPTKEVALQVYSENCHYFYQRDLGEKSFALLRDYLQEEKMIEQYRKEKI